MQMKLVMLLFAPILFLGLSFGRGDTCAVKGVALYNVTFEGKWSNEIFYKQYPLFRPHAQWSKAIGRSHSNEHVLWRKDLTASIAMKTFAENGKSEDFQETESQGHNNVLDMFSIKPIPSGVGQNWAIFIADEQHNLLSTATRIVPSPDWFVGVDSLNLCEEQSNTWVESASVDLYPLDAGTDKGFTFTAPNWAEDPFRPIFQISSKFPAHPANSFYYPEMDTLPPIAALHVQLMEVSRTEDTSNAPSEATQIKPILKNKNLVTSPSPVSTSTNNKSTVSHGNDRIAMTYESRLELILNTVKNNFNENIKVVGDGIKKDMTIRIFSEKKINRKRQKAMKRKIKQNNTLKWSTKKNEKATRESTNKFSTFYDVESSSKPSWKSNYKQNRDRFTQQEPSKTASTKTSYIEFSQYSMANSPTISNKIVATHKSKNRVTSGTDISDKENLSSKTVKSNTNRISTKLVLHKSNRTTNGFRTTFKPFQSNNIHHHTTTKSILNDFVEEHKYNPQEVAAVELSQNLAEDLAVQNSIGVAKNLNEHVEANAESEIWTTIPLDGNSVSIIAKKRHKLTAKWQPVSCELSEEWAPWTACSKTCGYGSRTRIKLIAREAKNGGSKCTQTPEKEMCGSLRNCYSWKYFQNWGVKSPPPKNT